MAKPTATIEILLDVSRAVAQLREFDRALSEIARALDRARGSFEGFATIWWLAETRRRVWFWRGLIGEEKAVPPAGWWYIGRRTGELVAEMRGR